MTLPLYDPLNLHMGGNCEDEELSLLIMTHYLGKERLSMCFQPNHMNSLKTEFSPASGKKGKSDAL